MNFFRSLGGALIVALFGTLALGGGSGPHDVEGLIRGTEAAALATTFRWVFLAADAGLALAFLFLVMIEERSLRAHPGEAPGIVPMVE